MPKQLLLLLGVLLMGAWFLIVERQNFWEKIYLIVAIVVIFATYRVLTGATPEQIFIPVFEFFK